VVVEQRTFGSSGEQVVVIGQGTWDLKNKEKAVKALQLGLELGLTHIDTAEMYIGSETVVKEAVGDRRDGLFLVSKVIPTNASYKGTIQACNESLEKLGTDHLDCYLLHWWGGDEIEDTMRAFGELIDTGKTRFVGVSNFSVDQLEIAQQALGSAKLVCNQVQYNLNHRYPEEDLLEYCLQHDVALVGYCPFRRGGLPTTKSPKGKILNLIGEKYEKTAAQVALNFLVRKKPLFAIPKAESLENVRLNAAALDFKLDSQDLDLIQDTFPVK